MTDDRPSEVLGALPHSRPHRRSDKRAAAKAKDAASPAPSPKTGSKTKTQAKAKTPKAKAGPKASPATKTKAGPGAAKAKAGPRGKAKPSSERLRQPAQPAGTPSRSGAPVPTRTPSARAAVRRPAPRRSGPPSGPEILGTAVQAAAELAEIGLTATARALRNALARLPRP